MQRDLARELRRGEMRSARVPKKAPPDASGPGYFETFPRAAVSGKSKPTLLCDLERLLRDKLRLARLTGAGADDGDDARSLSTSDDDATYELASLDAYRQTFDAFVDAFVTYKPLLSEIKTRYDRALDAALRSERACAGLRAEVAAAERRRLAEVREARAETMTKAANVRGDALRRAAAAEAKVAAAEARAAAAEAETARWRAHAEAADRRTAEAEEKSAALRRRVDAETSWAEARGDAAERLLSSEMYPVPRDFARADAELEDGEGGLNREPGGGEPSCARRARGDGGGGGGSGRGSGRAGGGKGVVGLKHRHKKTRHFRSDIDFPFFETASKHRVRSRGVPSATALFTRHVTASGISALPPARWRRPRPPVEARPPRG
jgi:hypothetical protein